MTLIVKHPVDAEGGSPTVYEPRCNWFNHMEDSAGFHDVQRFLHPELPITTWAPTGRNVRGLFRRLDYLMVSSSTIERITDDSITAISRTDHRLVTAHINLGREKISGPGLWRHNDLCLKEEEYCKLIEETIQEATKVKLSNTRSKWDYIKYKIRAASMAYCKSRNKEKREVRIKLEKRYAEAIMKGNNHEQEVLEARLQLEKYFQDEDDSIRFRAKIEDVEHGEKLSSYFFREIKKNQDESNVKSLKTTAHPEGTQTRKETMTALEDHFKNEFKETNIGGKPDDSWFSGLPTISDSLKEDLEKPICINDLTHALFKELKPSKTAMDSL